MPGPTDNGINTGFTGMLICLAILLVGCSDGGGSSDCSASGQNRFVHQDMLDRYYWYQQVPGQVNYGRFDSPQQMIEFLRYDTFDRFSYVTTQTAFNNLFNNGSFIG